MATKTGTYIGWQVVKGVSAVPLGPITEVQHLHNLNGKAGWRIAALDEDLNGTRERMSVQAASFQREIAAQERITQEVREERDAERRISANRLNYIRRVRTELRSTQERVERLETINGNLRQSNESVRTSNDCLRETVAVADGTIEELLGKVASQQALIVELNQRLDAVGRIADGKSFK